MENNKFIDLNGLELIWSKIDNSLTEVNTKIKELTKEVATLKEQVDNIEPKLPDGYVLAKDSDFAWVTSGPWEDGAWNYIGKADKVAIPHTINSEKVTSYKAMFYGTPVSGVYSDNQNVTDMTSMFYYSTATNLDLSHFNTSGVTNMTGMFQYSKATSLNLSGFNTSNVTDMSKMFYYSEVTNLDISNFDTSKVTKMGSMFEGYKATSLDLSKFNTSRVTDMSWMFRNSKTTSLDLSHFNTSNVTNMSEMFSGSEATTLDLSSFDTSKVTYMEDMFLSSKAKEGYARTKEDANKFNNSSNKPSTLTFTVKQKEI